uniref:M15 family metallopeptidase n=1 Tax=Nocardioides sp. TaxID=35761 RepID=UPI002B26C3BB
APPHAAPHTAGAAVDVVLTTPEGVVLDVGCPIDSTPEESAGRCYTDHPDVTGEALLLRRTLIGALTGAGLVNYPTEWWHWSYGDRYWARTTGAPHALFEAHGPPSA